MQQAFARLCNRKTWTIGWVLTLFVSEIMKKGNNLWKIVDWSKILFCITVYLLGYIHQTNTRHLVGSTYLKKFYHSLEAAVEGCNEDSRCDLILDSGCNAGSYLLFEGTTQTSKEGSCVWVRKNIILIFDATQLKIKSF